MTAINPSKQTDAADVRGGARRLHEPLRALHHVERVAAAVILDVVLAHELLVQRQTRLVGQNRVVRLQRVPERCKPNKTHCRHKARVVST